MIRRSWYFVPVVLTMALAVTALPVAGPPAVRRTAAASSSRRVSSRPDRISAMSTAQAQGSRVEDLSQRTPTSSTYANPNGTWTTEAYAGVVRAKDSRDQWVPVDATVHKNGNAYEPAATPFDLHFSGGGDTTIGTATTPQGEKVKVGWSTQLPAPAADGDTLKYPGVAPDTDLVVNSRTDGFDYSMVLHKVPDANAPPVEFHIPLTFDGTDPVVTPDGTIVLKHGKHPALTMTAPVMWDSATPNSSGTGKRLPVQATVEGTGRTRTLVLRPDMKYLTAPTTVYPVVVDPNVIINASYDSWVQSSGTTTSQNSSTELRVGSLDGGTTVARTYLYFDMSSVVPGATPVAASINLTNFATGDCAGSALRMSPLTSGWNFVTGTWATQPTTTTTASSTTTQAFGPGCGSQGTVSFDALALIKAYLAGAGNLGVQIKAEDETAASGFRKFRYIEYGQTAKAPQFVVTYNNPPNTPAATQVIPSTSDGTNLYAGSSTPSFSTVVSDPDGSQVTPTIQISQGSTVVSTTTLAPVASGTTATYQSPGLPDGTYSISWQASDGTATSAWSSAQSVIVDTTAPPPPSISCDYFAANTWYATDGTATGYPCTYTVAPGTKILSGTYNGDPIQFADMTGSTTYVDQYDMNGSGVYDLEVSAVDAAGNASAPTQYKFGIGTGALTKPADGTRSVRKFTVAATAQSGATSAYAQWRPAGGTTWTTATQVKKNGATWNGVPTTQGSMADTGDLDWYLGDETGMKNPGLVEVQFCFVYPTNPTTRCTNSSYLNLVPHAFGGNFPTSQVGPATVALQSGEFQLANQDVSTLGFSGDLTISRAYQSFGTTSGAQSVFGPGWAADFNAPTGGFAAARVVDNTATDGTISLVNTDGSDATYRLSTNGIGAQAVGVYVGQGQAAGYGEKLEIQNTAPKSLVLTESDGTVTTWKFTSGTTWHISSVQPPTAAPATTFTYSGENVTGIYDGVPGVTCTSLSQARGCHALLMTYTTINGASRLTQINLKTWDPSATLPAMTSTPVMVYTYDTTGELTGSYDPREDTANGHLATTYTYQSVGGRTYLATMTPPGEKTWTFNLNADGTLSTITRPQDAAIGGTATWRITYGIATSGSGLPNLTRHAVDRWDQPKAPDAGTAVFGPDAPGTSDLTYADLTYFTTDGETTNTASYGAGQWQIDSFAHDTFGNETWSLTAGALRAGLDGGWNQYALSYMLSTRTFYNAAGTRVEFVLGPDRFLEREDGTTMMGRPRTDYVYDDEAAAQNIPTPGRPTPSTDPYMPKPDIVVERRDSISTWDGEPIHASGEQIYDTHKTRYRYDKVVSTDGDGWVLQKPTRTSVDLNGGWSTTLDRYDTYGRLIEERTPEGVSTLDGAGTDAKSTLIYYFTAGTTSPIAACRSHPEWLAEPCQMAPAASTGYVPTATATKFDYLLNPTIVSEASGTMTRTSTLTYDKAGRKTSAAVSMAGAPTGDQSVPTARYTYSPTDGRLQSVSTTGGSVNATYDTWGRVTSTSDGAGVTSTTTYDAAGNVRTLNDGKGTYTYTYDGTDAAGHVEHRGLLTKLDVGLASGPSVFKAAYDAYGNAVNIVDPNGVVEKKTIDTAGGQQAVSYSKNGTTMYSDTTYRDVDGRERYDNSTGGVKVYSYDGRRRLTGVQDNEYWTVGCYTRTYTYSLDSNRTALSTAAPASGGGCSTASPTTHTSTFATDGRITDTGYTYDAFGRTRTVPAADTANGTGSALSTTYYANDMAASITQTVGSTTQAQSFTLDPLRRISQTTSSTNGVSLATTLNHYSDTGDSPAWTADQSRPDAATAWKSGWTRYADGIDGGLALVESSNGSSRLQLTNLHGDVVATLNNETSISTSLEDFTEATEYGIPAPQFAPYARAGRYGWLGAKKRESDGVGGLVLMGERLYNPRTGLFLSRDPVPGGNDNPYTYPPDPINAFDLNGQQYQDFGPCGCTAKHKKHHVTVSAPVSRPSAAPRPRNKFSDMSKDQAGQQPITRRHHGGPHDHDSHSSFGPGLGNSLGSTGLAIGGSETASAGIEGWAGVSEAYEAGEITTTLYVGGSIATGGMLVVGTTLIVGAYWLLSK